MQGSLWKTIASQVYCSCEAKMVMNGMLLPVHEQLAYHDHDEVNENNETGKCGSNSQRF